MEWLKIILAIIATPFLVVGIIYGGMFIIMCLREFVLLVPFILAFVIIIDLLQITLSATVTLILVIGVIVATVLMAIFRDS